MWPFSLSLLLLLSQIFVIVPARSLLHARKIHCTFVQVIVSVHTAALVYKLVGMSLKCPEHVWTQPPFRYLSSLQSVQSVNSKLKRGSTQPLSKYQQMAKIIECVEYGSNIENHLNPQVIKGVDLEWLIRIYGMLDINAVRMGCTSNKTSSSIDGTMIGSVTSLLNHSCHANAVRTVVAANTKRPVVDITASRNIKKGSSVRVNYTENCRSEFINFDARKHFLQNKFDFRCACCDCLWKAWCQKTQ